MRASFRQRCCWCYYGYLSCCWLLPSTCTCACVQCTCTRYLSLPTRYPWHASCKLQWTFTSLSCSQVQLSSIKIQNRWKVLRWARSLRGKCWLGKEILTVASHHHLVQSFPAVRWCCVHTINIAINSTIMTINYSALFVHLGGLLLLHHHSRAPHPSGKVDETRR